MRGARGAPPPPGQVQRPGSTRCTRAVGISYVAFLIYDTSRSERQRYGTYVSCALPAAVCRRTPARAGAPASRAANDPREFNGYVGAARRAPGRRRGATP